MAIKKLVQITAWSFSRFNDYTKCPALAKFKHIDRLKEPDNPAMARGNDVHGDAEHYVEDHTLVIPKSLDRFAEEFLGLREAYDRGEIQTELEWAFTREWKPCDWKDWNNAWLRVKTDLFQHVTRKGKVVGRVVDYKTGKVRKEHTQQLELYALGAFLMHSDLERVDTELWYLDEGHVEQATFERKQLETLKASWVKRTLPMLTDTRFNPNPNPHCKWCHFRKANHGPCPLD